LTGKLVKVPPAGELSEIGERAQGIVKMEGSWGNLSKGKKEIEGREKGCWVNFKRGSRREERGTRT
jgi:glycine cleavage system regulatory protein